MQTLKEFEYSGLLPNEYLEGPEIQRLIANRLIEIRTAGRRGFHLRSNGCSGKLRVGESTFIFIPQYGVEFLKALLPKAFNVSSEKTHLMLGTEEATSIIDIFIANYLTGYFSSKLKSEIRQDFVNKKVQTLVGSGRLLVPDSLLFLSYGVNAPSWHKSEICREHFLNAVTGGIYETAAKVLQVDLSRKRQLSSASEQIAVRRVMPSHESLEECLRLIDRRTEAYRELIEFAQTFLVNGTIGSGTTSCSGFLVQNWRIFEMAIRNILRKQRGNLSETIGRKRFCTTSRSRLLPDFLFSDENGNSYIADAKYISNSSLELFRGQMYQLNAYMDGYRVKSSVLIFPSRSTTRIKVHSLEWGNRIYTASVPVCREEDFEGGIAEIVDKCWDRKMSHEAVAEDYESKTILRSS